MPALAGFLLVLALAPPAVPDTLARPDSLALPRVERTATPSADSVTVPDSTATGPGLALTSETLVPAGDGLLIDPTGVAVDAFGRIYVSDAGAHRLVRFDAAGKPTAEFGSLGTDPSQMQRPSGVALLGTLGVAVLDRDNRRVLSIDLFGRPLGTLIDLAADDLERRVGRIDASAIASDRGGALALLDRERERVLWFDFAGRFVRELGGFGAAAGSFRGLRGIALGPHGELVCADRGNARLQRLDAGGHVAASWPIAVAPGDAALVLAVDGAGRIALADESTGALWLWSADGEALHHSRTLAHPRALAFAPDGALVVVESAPSRVRRLRFALPATTPREH